MTAILFVRLVFSKNQNIFVIDSVLTICDFIKCFFNMLGNERLLISYTLLPENHIKSLVYSSYYEELSFYSVYLWILYGTTCVICNLFSLTDGLLSFRPIAKSPNAWTPQYFKRLFTFHERPKASNTFQVRRR